MLTKVITSTITGIAATAINVEVITLPNANDGKPIFSIIGLADIAIREAKERVAAAIRNCGFYMPSRVLVNLSPAELKKEGSSFDLAIAVGVLAASKQIDQEFLLNRAFFGELSLDGKLRGVKGAAALVIEALNIGAKEVILPFPNITEANLVTKDKVVGLQSLTELVPYFKGELVVKNNFNSKGNTIKPASKSFCDVVGQEIAKRGLLIAAAGGHNLLMSGPPGCGKSMLAERLPSILPKLNSQEILEVVQVYSIAGFDFTKILLGERPYRAPHHNVSEAGLIGGGSNPKPGEISLAHKGVLFLDEFPEYKRSAIEALRTPLETGKIVVSRAKARQQFPARFQLVTAMNPCPCGKNGISNLTCNCSSTAIQGYLKKLSQPILERIDLHIELDPVPVEKITGVNNFKSETKSDYKQQVTQAYGLAQSRSNCSNSELDNEKIKRFLNAKPSAVRLLKYISEQTQVSARTYFRLLKVARTIADLELSEMVVEEHISEAFRYRAKG